MNVPFTQICARCGDRLPDELAEPARCDPCLDHLAEIVDRWAQVVSVFVLVSMVRDVRQAAS